MQKFSVKNAEKCVNYAENKLSTVDKIDNAFKVYQTTVERKAFQSLRHNSSSMDIIFAKFDICEIFLWYIFDKYMHISS